MTRGFVRRLLAGLGVMAAALVLPLLLALGSAFIWDFAVSGNDTVPTEEILQALERLELPVNIAADVARIELLGNRELYMDRHRGVLAYSTEEVDVNGGGVVVRIRGEGLQLLVMTEQELRLTGKIAGIELVE